jgi:hypothetical protein
VTMVISRKAGLLATVAVAGLLLVGCASGPGQAGSAAIVGGTPISLDSVQQELNGELANQPAPASGSQPAAPADQARQIVTDKVMDQVVDAAIGKYRLSVPAQTVSQYLDSSGGLAKIVQSTGLSSQEIQDLAHNQVALLDFAKKYLLKMRLAIDYTFVADQKTATTTAAKLAANPADVKSILQSAAGASGQISLDQQLTGGLLIEQQLQLEQQQQQGSSGASGGTVLPLFGAQAHTALAFPVSQGQWMVALVQRSDIGGVASANDTSALGQASSQDLIFSATEMLSPLAQQLGIRISPRYGIWDPVGMQVVASSGQAVGVELTAHTS